MTENKESFKKENVVNDVKSEVTGQTMAQREIKKERFDFVLTANNTIICQRYFHIHNFNPKSLTSAELYNAVMKCAEMIQRDLKGKTIAYLEAVAPQIFNTMNDMEKFLESPTFRLNCASVIYVKDCGKKFVLCDDTYDDVKGGGYFMRHNCRVRPYENKEISYYDTVDNSDSIPCTIKFAFRDNGDEVVSFAWDGNAYPRFVRSNIDITNRKNRFMTGDDKRKSFEWQMIEIMRATGKNTETGEVMYRPDLTGTIVREICDCCSQDKENDTYVKNSGRFDYVINAWDNSVSYHRRPKRDGKNVKTNV